MGKPKNFERSQHCWMSCWRGGIDDRVTCPYNSKHVMPYKRLVLHIIPCSKSNPELAAQFVTCPYNSLHRGPKEQLKEHLMECQEHQMSIFTRVNSGKKPYIEVYGHGQKPDVDQNEIKLETKSEQMIELETEWKEML